MILPINKGKGVMKKYLSVLLLLPLVLFFSGCTGEEPDGGEVSVVEEELVVTDEAGDEVDITETTVVVEDSEGNEEVIRETEVTAAGELVYLDVADAAASSFDQTPDWAPAPDPMAPVDGDMLTRWSSDYKEGDQWFQFDLGVTKTVSNVIIRWERAFATEYKILVSNNAQDWTEVYHETNSQGGMTEAFFSPVECRYVRILGLKRVNEDWGISIWEVEIYGPASANQQAEVSKEQYLAGDENVEEIKKAEELVEKMAAPVVPLSEKPFQRGVVYTSWMADELSSPASDIMLTHIKESGYDTVSIMIPAYQDTIQSDVIFTNDREGGDTPTLEALEHAVTTCHKLGLRVLIKPHIDPRTDEPRINIMPSEAWFDSMEKFVLRYAYFSQQNDVEMFSIGTELEATTFSAWAHRWDQLIDKVEQVYDGELTYSANWTEYKEVPFWDRMDYIGLDAYFPLTNEKEPSMEQLVQAWEGHADEIEQWREEKGLTDKPVILTEIGYPSADGANIQPWVAISDQEDQEEQARCLDATFTVLSKRPWFEGYYIWQYFPQDRWSPLGFTVKGKKAEDVLQKWNQEIE
jgi:hypothetical protein